MLVSVKESLLTHFNCLWQAEKVTVVFPMRFKDSIDTALATSFLQVLLVSYQRLLLTGNYSTIIVWSYSFSVAKSKKNGCFVEMILCAVAGS